MGRGQDSSSGRGPSAAPAKAAAPIAAEIVQRGRFACQQRDVALLHDAIRGALDCQPPRVPLPELRSWRDHAILTDDDPFLWWLDAACASATGQALPGALEGLERARLRFADLGDVAAEISVGMAVANIARRLDDVTALGRIIVRAGELSAFGHLEADEPARLGEALVSQMLGDSVGALRALDAIEPGALEGDWAAQATMLRGANLLLLDRYEEACAHLEQAVGMAGSWSQASALHLLAVARWRSGAPVQALGHLDAAEHAAVTMRASAVLVLVRTMRAVLLAMLGDATAPQELARLATSPSADPECQRLQVVARAMWAAHDGDHAAALDLVHELELPERPAVSSTLAVALACALSDVDLTTWTARRDERPHLVPAIEAGAAARRHLDGAGPLAGGADSPFLLRSWCEPVEPVVELRLLGRGSVVVDRHPSDAPNWERARVRELALYLALAPPGGRDLAADRLWPNLTSDAAARNLRVTLSYLRAVLDEGTLDPDAGSLIVERGGTIGYAEHPRLLVDLQEETAAIDAIADAAALGDAASLLASARRLQRTDDGPLLGGTTVGSWVDELARRRRDRVLSATSLAGAAALDGGDPELAEAMAQRGLAHDPWSERLYQILVRSRADRDDLDGARRALRDAVAQLADIGTTPEATTVELARSIGVDLR